MKDRELLVIDEEKAMADCRAQAAAWRWILINKGGRIQMSDRMTLIPFDRLMLWILKKKMNKEACIMPLRTDPDKTLPIFTEKIETPFGPQWTQYPACTKYCGIVLCGSRFFELKTVQILTGEDLP